MAGTVAGVAATVVFAGVEDSPTHPVLPEGAGPAPWLQAVGRSVGLQALGPAGLGAGSIVLALFTGGVFLLALREAWRGHLSERVVVALGVVFIAATLLVPLLYSRDVYSYAMYGRIASVHDANPYVAVPADFAQDPVFPFVGPKWRETPAVYGPAFTSLSAGLTRAISSLPALIVAFKAIAAAAAIGILLLATRVARRLFPQRVAFAAVLVSWNPVVLFHAVAGAHNDLLVGLSIAAALAFLALGRREVGPPGALVPGVGTRATGGWRPFAATAALTLGTLVKVTAVVPLGLAVVAAAWARPGRRARTLAAHGGVVLAIAAAFVLPFLQTTDPTLGQATLATHLGWLAPTRLLRVVLGDAADALAGDTARSVAEGAVRVAFALAFVAVVAGLVRETARRAGGGLTVLAEGAGWGWALLALTLLAPVLLPWYVVWLLPVAWLLPRLPRAVTVALTVAVLLSQRVAEPAAFPDLYRAVLLFGHYGLTPILLGLLVWLLLDLRRRLRAGIPLEAERPPAAGEDKAVPERPQRRRRERAARA